MPGGGLAERYRAYIAVLNRRDWPALEQHVRHDVTHNGRPVGLAGYGAMLAEDARLIPDLAFRIDLLVCDPPWIAARLVFDCHPAGEFLGLPVNGRRTVFAEHVFYLYEDGLIAAVRSVLDKPGLEEALARG